MRPSHPPTGVGDICWERSYPGRCSHPLHESDKMKRTGFSQHTHQSLRVIVSAKSNQQTLLRDVLEAPRRETLIVLKGDPGTGKSQLINWLKLSVDAAVAQGERSSIGDRTLRSVLIRRRSGSLKDALQQLVDQLPGYERLLS